jgi:transposase
MIRTSVHTINYSNTTKKAIYRSFLKEYHRVFKIILDKIWDNGYEWLDKKGNKVIFAPHKNLLNHPNFIDYNQFNLNTTLSARALSSLTMQLCAVLGASVEKQRKRLHVYNELKGKISKVFARALRRGTPKKPNVSNINAELSSKCCDVEFTDNHFDAFIQLKSIGENFGRIRLPINYTKHSNKLNGRLKSSFLFKNKSIDLRWENEVEPITEGIVVGADQGKTDVLTLSNNTKTPQTNNDGWTLTKIIKKLSRKIKGSKSFRKAQDHRSNFVHWSINKLNLVGVKRINLEKIWNIGYKNRQSREMSHWNNPEIRDKIISRCELLGVQVVEQCCMYRSQRCSNCGLVRKANRKGKVYKCKSCGFVCDADLNAAINHEQNLPSLPKDLRKLRMNLGTGFYWKPNGLFLFDGTEFRVPNAT